MLGQTLHIDRSVFRLLPNPTLFKWDTKNFDLPRLLDAYAYQLKKLYGGKKNPSDEARQIWRHIKILQKEIKPAPANRRAEPSLPLMSALHAALDDTDDILTFRRKETRPTMHREYTTKSKLMRSISDKPGNVLGDHTESAYEVERREMVRYVLRSHIQEVLSGFNPQPGKRTQDAPGYPATTTTKTKSRFEAIDAASPELKQAKLMEVYFKTVRQKVIDESQKSTDRRAEETKPKAAPAPAGYGLKRATTARTTRTVATIESEDEESEEEVAFEHLPEIEDDKEQIDLLDEDTSHETTHEDIWCTLVFRMICWLMLHDFHKNDVQLPKSELFGSRLPVYIA